MLPPKEGKIFDISNSSAFVSGTLFLSEAKPAFRTSLPREGLFPRQIGQKNVAILLETASFNARLVPAQLKCSSLKQTLHYPNALLFLVFTVYLCLQLELTQVSFSETFLPLLVFP